MNSVTFPEALGGNGQTYTDDADPDTGLDGLGYTTRFIPCLQQAVVMGLSAQSNAQAAAEFLQQCQTLREEVGTDRQAVADNRSHVDQQKGLVDSAAQQVATDRQAVADDRTHVDQQKGLVDSAAQQVATDHQAVADDRTHVDQQKGLVDSAAQQVATDRQAVADDRLASQQAAGASSDAADASIQARNEAQALYGDLNAVETAKTQAQQAATDAGQERGLAQTAREGAESAQESAETAAGQSQQAAAQAVTEHEAAADPHSQYELKTTLKAAAYREVVGGEGLLMAEGFAGLGFHNGTLNTLFNSSFNTFINFSGRGTVSGAWSGGPLGDGAGHTGMLFQDTRSFNNATYQCYVDQLGNSPRVYHRVGRGDIQSWPQSWARIYDTGNTTVDSNGFIKSASPIYRLSNISDSSISSEHGFLAAGSGAANLQAEGVTASHDAVGVYTVIGSLGFAAEGWTIEVPQDSNGNRLCVVKTEQATDGRIIVRTFSKRIDSATGDVVADTPMDIPDGRWIDLRLRMPEPPSNDHPDDIADTSPPLTPEEEEEARLRQLERWRAVATITPRQARLVLAKHGLLEGVAVAIAAIEDTYQRQMAEIEWEYATSIERAASWVNVLYSALGLSQTDVDRLFREAAQL